ncbi:MAG TPA: S8 family serine peptidase [Actinomycetota bacterium]|nr:S8 family serine peptidase [Actinomycetota bacterium]
MLRRVLAMTFSVCLVVSLAPSAGAAADPLASKQWALGKIQAQQAWSLSRGTGVTIAIVDTGIDLAHEDLRAQVVPGTSVLGCGKRAKSCNTTGQDDEGHGSHVAGIAAAATDNGIGVAGVAPGAKLMPVKVLNALGEGTVDQIAAGIDYAHNNGAKVINLSLGVMSGQSQIGATLGWWKPINDAINRAWAKGAVIVVAAGNDSFPLCAEPAAHAKAICVGATDHNDLIASYSNSGDIDVTAPGGFGSVFCEHSDVDILSTMWTGSAWDCQGTPTNGGTPFMTGYETAAGTSMAAPHVSGVAALLLAKGLTNQQTVDKIKSSADDLGSPGYDPVYGAGRINAFRAVS